MAYPHSRALVPMTVGTATLDFTTTGDKARWSPGYLKVIIRAVAVELNAAPGDAGIVRFDKRVTFASDTGRINGGVATVNLATTHAAGSVVYKDGLNATIEPGEEVVVTVTDASAGVSGAKVTLYVEPQWENPANFSKMRLSS
jgi:hypothetical protein